MIPRISKFCTCLLIAVFVLSNPASKAVAQQNRKSPFKAFMYSLLVPGLGQKYVDNVGNARYFIAAEVILVGLTVGHEKYSDWLEEDYRAFAASHAGVDHAGKEKDYFVIIARYNSIYQFNKKMRIDRDFESVLPETTENIWYWDSDENRNAFLERRIDADRIHNRTIYFYSGIFLNHVLSGIHAAFKAKRHNPTLPTTKKRWDLRFLTIPSPENPTHEVKLSLRF